MLKYSLLFLLCSTAHAHESWSNGKPIPTWVKDKCCGESDAHDLDAEGIAWWQVRGGYKIEGIDMVITHPYVSQDGHAWAFYLMRARASNVFCFFVPTVY
jgi:hypothetical protein